MPYVQYKYKIYICSYRNDLAPFQIYQIFTTITVGEANLELQNKHFLQVDF